MARLLLLVVFFSTTASAQSGDRLSVSGSATAHAVFGDNAAEIVSAALIAVDYQSGESDRLGLFAFVSPEGPRTSSLVAVGGAWDILLTPTSLGPYITVGVAGVHQAGSEDLPCRIEDGCFRESYIDRRAFTAIAPVIGVGARIGLGRGGFVRADARALVSGTEAGRVRPLFSLGGGVHL